MSLMCRAAVAALAAALAACSPSTQPNLSSIPAAATEQGRQAADEAPGSNPEQLVAPAAVEAFEMYCYQTNASYDLALRMVEAMGLVRLEDKFDPMVAPLQGAGTAYYIEVDAEADRLMLLSPNERGACSVFAKGYDDRAIRQSMLDNYNLKHMMTDDAGLQINEAFIPNGVNGTIGEAAANGMIGITTAKTGPGITVAYVSPEAAQEIFSQHP